MMKVMLLRAARIQHNAGEIVTVSPEVAQFLVAVGSAEVIPEVEKEAEKPRKRSVKKS